VALGSPELEAILDTIAEGALERDRDRQPPYALVEVIRRSRLGALRVPVSRGGGGHTLRELFEFVIRLADADPNLAHILRNHFSFTENRLRSTREGEPNPWLDQVVAGSIFGHATTELGSSVAGGGEYATSLTPTGDHYLLNGTKYYCTGSMYADWVVVQASLSASQSATAIVPTSRPGVDLKDDWDGMGQRLTGSGTTLFVDVVVYPDEIIANPQGPRGPGQATFPQLYLTAIIAGILRNMQRDAVALIRRRERSFYHAPAERPVDDPILQQTVGQIASNAFAAEAVVLAAADALDRSAAANAAGRPDPDLAASAALRAAEAKVVVDEIGQRTGGLLFDAGGASATKYDALLDRHWRNARTLSSHNPWTYKARCIGDYQVNGTPLPQGAYF
jgi:alkylation response protein AidB-like acyl-CoA dehydrogenase